MSRAADIGIAYIRVIHERITRNIKCKVTWEVSDVMGVCITHALLLLLLLCMRPWLGG